MSGQGRARGFCRHLRKGRKADRCSCGVPLAELGQCGHSISVPATTANLFRSCLVQAFGLFPSASGGRLGNRGPATKIH